MTSSNAPLSLLVFNSLILAIDDAIAMYAIAVCT